MNIVVEHTFTPPCLKANLKLWIIVDDYFDASIGSWKDGVDYYTFDPISYDMVSDAACGDTLTLRINASNSDDCGGGSEASITYAVFSDSCYPASNEEYYDGSVCGSRLCSEAMRGCRTCTEKTVCTGVVDNTYILYPNGTVDTCSNIITNCQ